VSQSVAVLGFLLVSAGIVASLLFAGWLLRVRARTSSPLKRRPYECGEEPAGMAWMQFHARYYLVAIFFVLFDLEAVFLFPWATASRALGPGGLVAVVGFVLVLLLGWLYGMRKDALRWQ
jgi:NADH-quinone oxidoreductase subunit A